jgi:hypothetical protein
MDTIGLLAAWLSIISLLFALGLATLLSAGSPYLGAWWATTTPQRAKRRVQKLLEGLEANETPGNSYLADLIALYGSAVLHVVGAVGLVMVAIITLDLGPALLAAILPFHFDAKVLTRITGLLLLAGSYLFMFRLAYLALRINRQVEPRKASYRHRVLTELSRLRKLYNLPNSTSLDGLEASARK